MDEAIIKDIHAILIENIMVGGIYRNVEVYISGAAHTPPAPNEMYHQVKDFYADLAEKDAPMSSSLQHGPMPNSCVSIRLPTAMAEPRG